MVENPYVGQLLRLIDFRDDERTELDIREEEDRVAMIGQLVHIRGIYARLNSNPEWAAWVIELEEGEDAHLWPTFWFESPGLKGLVGRYKELTGV